jgi:hypothetical protein
MTTEEKILHLKDSVDAFSSQIDTITESKQVGLSLFILSSCLVDTVSFYVIDKDKNGERYKLFVAKYLGKINPVYLDKKVAKTIYESIRCSVVHSFTISNGVILGENISKLHLTFDIHGNLIVNLGSFYSDIKQAIRLVFKDIDKDKGLQKLIKKRYSKQPPFEVYKTINKVEGENIPVSGTTSLPIKSYKVTTYGRRKKYDLTY